MKKLLAILLVLALLGLPLVLIFSAAELGIGELQARGHLAELPPQSRHDAGHQRIAGALLGHHRQHLTRSRIRLG